MSTSTAPLQIRLVGSNNANEGRLEVLHDNDWNTVCSDLWSVYDAIVSCRQLGLPDQNAEVLRNAEFGEGSEKIWLDDVDCFGWENSLDECSYLGRMHISCGHEKDAGIRCKNGP